MNVLIVQFSLQGIDHETYAEMARQIAPGIAGTHGLITKMWLSDREANRYGGVYYFESREAIEGYLNAPLIKEFLESGVCGALRIEVFDILKPASVITAGPFERWFAVAAAA